MTIQQLYDKYESIRKRGYETVTLAEILKDLYRVRRIKKLTTKTAEQESESR